MTTSAKVALSPRRPRPPPSAGRAAGHQASQITSASDRIGEIAASIEQVSRNSAESADVASARW